MALIKVKDLAFGRLRSPDLDVAEEFLTHFGMIRAARTPTALYMRGTDPRHHIHVTEKGDSGFIGFAYLAASEDDLHRVAKAPGASAVESIGRARRRQARAPARAERLPDGGRPRHRRPSGHPRRPRPHELGLRAAAPQGHAHAPGQSPAPIKRIGHGVMGTPKVRETAQWFRDTLGFIGSDDVYVGDKDNIIGSFNRCDCGDEFVDHHTLFCVHNERAGLNHMSFEVPDVDAVFKDHEYLAGLGKYEHMWGVGRHLLGSQVYDYWADPWGRVHERWADTDRLNARSGSNLLPANEALVSQWGEDPPEKFIRHVTV